MNDFQKLRDIVQNNKGKKQLLMSRLRQEKARLLHAQHAHKVAHQAQLILQESARITQQNLRYRIETLVATAMQSVFNDPYKIDIRFITSREKTATEISFLLGNEQIDPLSASGGGAVDVASLALQISLWSLQNPRKRSLFILDEPLKWLKGGTLPEKGAQLIHQLSHRLSIQIIMVSHSPELIQHADRVFSVTKRNNVSIVEKV